MSLMTPTTDYTHIIIQDTCSYKKPLINPCTHKVCLHARQPNRCTDVYTDTWLYTIFGDKIKGMTLPLSSVLLPSELEYQKSLSKGCVFDYNLCHPIYSRKLCSILYYTELRNKNLLWVDVSWNLFECDKSRLTFLVSHIRAGVGPPEAWLWTWWIWLFQCHLLHIPLRWKGQMSLVEYLRHNVNNLQHPPVCSPSVIVVTIKCKIIVCKGNIFKVLKFHIQYALYLSEDSLCHFEEWCWLTSLAPNRHWTDRLL